MLSSLTKWLFSANRMRAYAWASLVSQILIVFTGGLVRLTGSGLGCPTWPKCTDSSLTTVPAQGYHGVIEFTNRMLTFVLLVIAIATLVATFNKAIPTETKLRLPAVLLFLGIPAQAVLGGFTVLTKLNPWLVGCHFLLSALMIITATVLVWRVYAVPTQFVPAAVFNLSPAISASGALTVVFGVLVTGAGPHAGDANSVRNGLNLEAWYHYHSYPAYAVLLLTFTQTWLLYRARERESLNSASNLALKISVGLLITLIAQAIIGILQARWGVPAGFVAAHMLGASMLVSLLTFNHLATRLKN